MRKCTVVYHYYEIDEVGYPEFLDRFLEKFLDKFLDKHFCADPN